MANVLLRAKHWYMKPGNLNLTMSQLKLDLTSPKCGVTTVTSTVIFQESVKLPGIGIDSPQIIETLVNSLAPLLIIKAALSNNNRCNYRMALLSRTFLQKLLWLNMMEVSIGVVMLMNINLKH